MIHGGARILNRFFLFSFAFHSDYLAACINDGSQVNCQPEIDFYSKFSHNMTN